MQKKVIALAVAGLVSGAAFAQSNVTIYGVADAAYVYSKGNTGDQVSATGVRTPADTLAGVAGSYKFAGIFAGGWNSPRVGFKGSENLGGGLKAIFQMEFGTDIDVDAGLAKTRKAFVGLSGNFGEVTAGRLYAPGADTLDNTAMDGATFSPTQVFFRSLNDNKSGTGIKGTTMGGGSLTRWNNAIGFESKKYGGFSAKAVYAFGETGSATGLSYDSATGAASQTTTANTATAKTTDNGRFGLKVAYANGPFNADVIYHKAMNLRTAYPDTNTVENNRQGGDINEWYIGGGYDFKAVKVLATYQQTRSDWSTGAAPTATTTSDAQGNIGMDVWSLGAIIPVGASGKVRLEYANVKYRQSDDSVINPLLKRDGRSTGMAVGYTHDLSKRTMLYTSYNYIKNGKNSMNNGGDGSDDFTGATGESNSTFMMGVSHKF